MRVRKPGLLTTVQDLGRHGHQREGVPVSGAMDKVALRIANLLLGNLESEAGLEITLVGPQLEFPEATLIALTGADLGAKLNGRTIPLWRPIRVEAGSFLTFAGHRAGCRAYLAVAGGIAVPPVLGSRSTYLRAGIGGYHGRALAAGDTLLTGEPSALSARIAAALGRGGAGRWTVSPAILPLYMAAPEVRALPGAHFDTLTPHAQATLWSTAFRVAPESDRMGFRLQGGPLALSVPLEMHSEGVAMGTVQLPPGGSPIILMADRQTTGGYPRIAQVATVDLPLLAQLRPGDTVRFRLCSLETAQTLLLLRERDLARFTLAVGFRHQGGAR